jgi:PAS domain-containing protein
MDERFERAPVGMLAVETGGTVRAVNETASDLLDVSAAEAAGAPIEAVVPDSVDATVSRAFDNTPVTATSVEEYCSALDRWLAVSLVPGEETVTVYLRDVSERHRLERRLTQRDASLTRVTIINQLIADVLAELVDASTREEIAATICDRLGETDIYEFAWVGERDLGIDDLVIRAGSGDVGRTLDSIEECLNEGTAVPEQRAIQTESPEISSHSARPSPCQSRFVVQPLRTTSRACWRFPLPTAPIHTVSSACIPPTRTPSPNASARVSTRSARWRASGSTPPAIGVCSWRIQSPS